MTPLTPESFVKSFKVEMQDVLYESYCNSFENREEAIASFDADIVELYDLVSPSQQKLILKIIATVLEGAASTALQAIDQGLGGEEDVPDLLNKEGTKINGDLCDIFWQLTDPSETA